MADAVDRADDGVAAFDHAVDAHERVFLAAIVVHQLGAHAGRDAAQIVDRATAAADIENASCDGRLDRLFTSFCTGARRRTARGTHPLLPAQAFELLLEIADHALGGTRPLAGNGQGALAPGWRLIATALDHCCGHRGHEGNGYDRAFAELHPGGVALENDLAMALGLAQ